MNESNKKHSWLTWLLYFMVPILVISYLGVLMADGQVRGQFEAYADVAEYDSLETLAAVGDDTPVMVRGTMMDTPALGGPAEDLLVYQEEPLDDRELRYGEEFPVIFPAIMLEMTDGVLIVQPSYEKELRIAHQLHEIDSPETDREYTGFRAGDVVTVQGVWISAETPTLFETTGITSLDRDSYLQEWQSGFDNLHLVSNIMGIVTLISVVLFIRHLIQNRRESRQSTQTPVMQS